MASKKRKRRPPPRATATSAAGPARRPSPAGRQSPTSEEVRRQRREEAREHREAIRRRAARRTLSRKVGIALIVVVLLGAGVLSFIKSQAATAERKRQENALLASAAAAATAAGCNGVQNIGSTGTDDRQHTDQVPQLDSYPSQPPASGPHNPTPLDAGVYSSPPNIGMAIHSLEHGAAEVWLAPGSSGPEMDKLKAALGGQDHVIVAPYSYPGPGGTLPAGRQMALVAWHNVQYCDHVSAAVAVGFVQSYRYDPGDPGSYKGEAPELGLPI